VDPQKLIHLHTSFLQNYSFLAPEQKQSGKSIDSKVDTYAFGILGYYLLMGEYPEGVFELPSARHPEHEWDWDKLVISCLQYDPAKRPEVLMPLLETIRQPSTVVVIENGMTGNMIHPVAESFIGQINGAS